MFAVPARLRRSRASFSDSEVVGCPTACWNSVLVSVPLGAELLPILATGLQIVLFTRFA
jgi:hypothetical protein